MSREERLQEFGHFSLFGVSEAKSGISLTEQKSPKDLCFLPRLPSTAVLINQGTERQTLMQVGQLLHQEHLCSLGSSRNLG